MGRGVGYAASGAMTVGRPVIGPVVNAGRDIVEEARGVTSGGRGRKGGRSGAGT
jgi:hypothetical protein